MRPYLPVVLHSSHFEVLWMETGFAAAWPQPAEQLPRRPYFFGGNNSFFLLEPMQHFIATDLDCADILYLINAVLTAISMFDLPNHVCANS